MEASRDETTGKWSLSGVQDSKVTFTHMCAMLIKGENFKFARYGDGEFNCMFGKFGHNCDGHEYFPDLGTALNNAFYSDPKYMVGIQPLAVQSGMWERAIQREGYPKNIYDADVLHSASIDGDLYKLVNALMNRRVVLIGPIHLTQFAHKNKWAIYTIYSKNCWMNYKEKLELLQTLKDNVVVLLCASMMSEVLIDELKQREITMIDCGSVFDPHVGIFSRRYHHKLQLA